MSSLSKFAILISFFALWITIYFSYKHQQIIGFVVIFLFGILHGANDLALFQKINDTKTSLSLKKMLLYYIAIVIFGATLFYSIPVFALSLFILLSSYHFGEQHWNTLKMEKNNRWFTFFQTSYGLFILFLLFSFHQEEVETILSQITGVSAGMLDFSFLTFLVGVLMIILGFIINRNSIQFKSEIVLNIFYLMVFAIIFKSADLIWAFAIYFVVWHSIPSIKEQINFLYGDFNFKNFKRYFLSAFVYWIASLFGISILYFLFKDQEVFDALFFSFLAAITFPHTIVILKMQNKV